MSTSGAPTTPLSAAEGRTADGRPLRVAIIAATWHRTVMDGLIAGARRAAADAQIDAELVRVPGSFELPVAAARIAPTVDAVIALGVVIRGGTPHFDYVCQAATQGLTQVSVTNGKPVGFGLLTCDDEQQAFDRAGLEGSVEDKGYEAMDAALRTARVLADR